MKQMQDDKDVPERLGLVAPPRDDAEGNQASGDDLLEAPCRGQDLRRRERGSKSREKTSRKDKLQLTPALEAEELKNASMNFPDFNNGSAVRSSPVSRTARQKRAELLTLNSSDDEMSHDSTVADRPGAFQSGIGGREDDCDGTVQYSAVEPDLIIGTATGPGEHARIANDDDNNEDTPPEKLVVAELAPEPVVATVVPWHMATWKKLIFMLLAAVLTCILLIVVVVVLVYDTGPDDPAAAFQSFSPATTTPVTIASTPPSGTPSMSLMPTQNLSKSPTTIPSPISTIAPTPSPSQNPTMRPSAFPTTSPTMNPTTTTQHIETILSSSFPGLPVSPLQERALTWLLEDDSSLQLAGLPTLLLERFILATIFYAMNGDEWTGNTLWLSERSVCSWEGVVCHGDGQIVEISLNGNNIAGSVPFEIGYLSRLARLSLSSSELTGTIPTELGQLPELGFLNFVASSLSGRLPTELGDLTSMTGLGLSSNSFTGTIPTELGRLSNLAVLFLSINNLSGTIPTEIGGMTSVTFFGIGGNLLTGTIPTELGELRSMTSLDLGFNNLSGSVPTELDSLEALVSCGLDYNPNLIPISNTCSFS